jgi:integrase
MLEVNNVRKGFFEHDEYLRLREALPDESRPILTFAYYTGCRNGEILDLQWHQEHFLGNRAAHKREPPKSGTP